MQRLIPLLLAAVIASPLAAAPASPETPPPWMSGFEAAKKKDWATAAKSWKPLAEKGNPQAQFFMAELYRDGLGVEKNADTALNYLRKAAEAGLPIAQFNYGNWFFLRAEDEKAYHEAARWWRLAAEKNFYPAQFNMAILYHLGQGVPKDIAQARSWYERAAANGSKPAAKALAKLDAGDETPPMVKKARRAAPSSASQSTAAAPITAASTTPPPKVETAKEPPPPPAPDTSSARPREGKVIYGAVAPEERSEKPRPLQSAVIAHPAPSAQPASPDNDLGWVNSRPADHYALQIFSGLQLENAQQVANSARSLGRTAIFPFSHEGLDWYGVILGDYRTNADAKQAAPQVAATLGVNAPWVRSFGDVQKSIPK